MPNLYDKEQLDNYIDDLVFNRQDHEEDDPVEVAGALIYAIQTRERFDEQFQYYLKNVSYSEKKQIREIIKYTNQNANPPITEQQRLLFSKLLRGLPKDSVAKKNEVRRNQDNVVKHTEDAEFLKDAANQLSTLKRKIGEELRKKVVNNVTVTKLQNDIVALKDRVQTLLQSKDVSILKLAQQAAYMVLETPEQIQAKLDTIEVNHQLLLTSKDTTPDDLNKIQAKLATNTYAYSHLPQVREKAQVVLDHIRELRTARLDPEIMKDYSVLDALKVHKAWDDGVQYRNPKFGKFHAELIREGFYVMRGESQGEKNDIKMHVSIDPLDANIAMEIINDMAQSEEYSDLIHEFKIGDIDYIQERISANTKAIEDALPEIDVNELIKAVKDNPNMEEVINHFSEKVPVENKEQFTLTLKNLIQNNVGAIISAERILHEALFTVYFKRDITQDNLKGFCSELNERLHAQRVKPGETANTDVSINPYCGITIDHVVENGKKIYLEGDRPDHILKRHQAIRENPMTKEMVPETIVPPPEDVPLPHYMSQLNTMVEHVDEKDFNGLSAFTAKGLSAIPLDDRVAFAGLLVAERFKKTNNVNLVYRNPDMFAKSVVKQILTELDFPIAKDEKVAFFQLVEKATSTPPDEAAIAQLKQRFTDPDPKIVQMLLPFYHEYLESVKKEFDAGYKDDMTLPKDEQRKAYYQAREDRLHEAKKQFLGHVSFPFVESLVFELQEKDDFSPTRKAKLAQGFRSLREKGIMDDLLKSLDTKNEGYTPTEVNPETIEKAFTIYQQGKQDYQTLRGEHRQAMLPVEQRATELYKTVNKIAGLYPKDSDLRGVMERVAGSIENIKTELDHKLLRGEKITEQDIVQVNTLFDAMMRSVKQSINTTNQRGENLLHDTIRTGNKEQVEALLKAGADPRMKTSHYKRGFFGALKDALNGMTGHFFKDLTTPPPRTATDFAKILGKNDILESLQASENELNIQDNETQQGVTRKLEKLENLVGISNDIEVDLPESNVLKFEREPTEKVKSDFVAGWIRRINEELVTLKDGQFTTDQNKIACYALNQIKNFMEARSNMTPPDLNTLNAVIARVTHEALIPFPPEVKLMLRQMGEGTLLPVEKPVSERLLGDKTEFVEKWEMHISEVMKTNVIPKYFLQQIQDYLAFNPAMTTDKLDGLEKVLKRIEAESKDAKPELKQIIDGMRKGVLPEDAPKVQMRRN